MKTVCQRDMCAGCGACIESCSQSAIQLVEKIRAYNAVIDESKCIDCGKCFRVCPQNFPAPFRHPVEWRQGWSANEHIRENSSSGGLATAIAKSFIENGGIVCTCKFSKGQFGFHFVNDVEELSSCAGSKYVKSSPYGVYNKLKKELNIGNRVLFIGLPCQVSAVINYAKNSKLENLYTIDLICHGTPSVHLLSDYLQHFNVNIQDVANMDFREKAQFGLFVNRKAIDNGVQDNYTTAFLTSLSYTENCYHCDYAQERRVSDLTLGDSWNSDLPAEERDKGISLVLCQTAKGKCLLERANLQLFPVDCSRAKDANAQLMRPSAKPEKREFFFDRIEKGRTHNQTMLLIDPKRESKKMVKRLLTRIGIIKGEMT